MNVFLEVPYIEKRLLPLGFTRILSMKIKHFVHTPKIFISCAMHFGVIQ